MVIKTKHKIAIARVLQTPINMVRKLLRLPMKVEVRRAGLKWHLDLDQGIDFAIYITGKFEPFTLRAIGDVIDQGDIVLDIGANIGALTLPLAQIVGKKGKVIAFEPTKYAYTKLLDNLSLNPNYLDRVSAEQIMLVGADNATPKAELYSSWPLDPSEQQHEKHRGKLESTEGARVSTLDTYIYREKIDNVRLVKIDVDGFEVEVVRGGLNFLKQQQPIIIMELAPYTLDERGSSLEQLLKMLSSVGYVLCSQDNGHELPASSSELRAFIPDGGSINVIARAN